MLPCMLFARDLSQIFVSSVFCVIIVSPSKFNGFAIVASINVTALIFEFAEIIYN